MPSPDPDRLRTALDQLAAEDAAAVDEALTRAMTVLKAVQDERSE